MSKDDIILYHNTCLISGAEDIYPLKGYEDNYLVRSRSSKFVFCSRIPTEEELLAHYSDYPIGYGADSEITKTRINEILDGFEQFRKTNKILDVGCGPGLFLVEAKKRGWEVFGTEFTDKQLEYLESKGISTEKGKLTDDSFIEGMFDVIISSEVIEHINNPIEEMGHFHRLLRKGGLVYITTPNFNALERFLLKHKYSIIEYPEHLSYYTPRTLNFLLKRSGFRKKRITTTGISIARIRNSRKRKSAKEMDSTHNDDQLRATLEKGGFNWIKKIVNALLNFFRLGNSLKAWYIKE